MPLTLSSLKTEVPTRKYGVLRLRYITMDDSVYMHEMSQRALRPHELAALILHHQLEDPALELTEVQAWPTRRLVWVARAWAANPHALDTELPAEEPLIAFQQAAADYWTEQRRQMQEALDQMATGHQWAIHQAEALAGWKDQLHLAQFEVISGGARSIADSLAVLDAWSPARDAFTQHQRLLATAMPKVDTTSYTSAISKFQQDALPLAKLDIKSSLVDSLQATAAVSKLQQEALNFVLPDYGLKSAALEVSAALQHSLDMQRAMSECYLISDVARDWDRGIGRLAEAASLSLMSSLKADWDQGIGRLAAESAASKLTDIVTDIGLGSTKDYIVSIVGNTGLAGVKDGLAVMMADTVMDRHNALLDDMRSAALASEVRWMEEFRASALAAEAAWQKSVVGLVGALTLPWKFPLLPPPPDPEVLRWQAERMARGQLAIEAAGFGFAAGHMSAAYVMEIGDLPPDEAPEIVSSDLHDWTRSPEFDQLLKLMFTRSRTLKRHWRCVRQDLEAHRLGLYVPAVRSTLSDIEGVFGDGLIIQNHAWGVRGKMYRMRGGLVVVKDHGKQAAQQKNQPKAMKLMPKEKTRPMDRQEMSGLKALVEWSDLRQDMAMRVMADLLLNRVHPDRNPIIHGRWTSFGTARRSTQMLLVLWVVARWVVDLERQLGQAALPRRLN